VISRVVSRRISGEGSSIHQAFLFRKRE